MLNREQFEIEIIYDKRTNKKKKIISLLETPKLCATQNWKSPEVNQFCIGFIKYWV